MNESLTTHQRIAIALTQGATHDVITKNMSVQSMCERTVELFEGMLAEVRRKYPEGASV
jgi:bacterioferritin-associated ferredoxin